MKIAIVGPICRDVNVVGEERFTLPGGVTYYAGQALVSLGVETVVFGSCGSEDVEWASEFGFDFVPTGIKGTIGFENIYSEGDSPDERRQRAGTPNSIIAEDIPPGRLSGLDYLIFGPLYYDNIFASTIKEFAGRVRNASTEIVLSPQGMIRYLEGGGIVWRSPENVLRALPHVDYVFLDSTELKFISGEDRIEDGVHVFQDLGADNVIVTRGSEGSQLFLGAETYTVKAFSPKELVDTTGAGDSYMAGLLAAQEKYEDPIKQGEFAAMTATMAIERKGPFSGTVEEVLERLKLS